MAEALSISDTLVQDSIIRTVKHVCAMMIRHEASFVEKSIKSAYAGCQGQSHVFGSVAFIGQVTGIVYLCIPDDFAVTAAARVLGLTEEEMRTKGSTAVMDVIAEITNMTVGGFKNAICRADGTCKLTLPTIVRGDNLSVVGLKGTERHIFHFDCDGHRLIADIQLKQD
jgi:chemotaxis protein CheX